MKSRVFTGFPLLLLVFNFFVMSYYYFTICILLFYSCGGSNAGNKKKPEPAAVITEKKEDAKYINSIKLVSPEKNKLYSYNDQIRIAIESKDRFPVDSAEIFLNGKKIAVTGKNVFEYDYRIPEGKTGNAVIKVIAHHPEDKRGVAAMNIRVKPDKAPIRYSYKVKRTLPHDPKAYTQGLVYFGGFMYEGTGQYGESTIRKTDVNTGKILSALGIDSQLFGEGITIYNDKIYQITWRSRKGFIYDLKTFSLESTFTYHSEGWGITTAGDRLMMSDGTNKLYYTVPSTFSIVGELEVYDHNGEVGQLNELEYVDGLVWANVWMTDRIVVIDPETGAVKGELDMKDILPSAERAKLDDKDDVLNGIAYNPETGTFYVTGKRWPKMFEIVVDKDK